MVRALRFFSLVLIGLLLVLEGLPQAVQAQGDGEPIQVGVVVLGADQTSQAFCLTLPVAGATGLDALEATGLELAVETGTMGSTVCRIGPDGCVPPGESCFCQCEPGSDGCVYWTYLHLGTEGRWQYSSVGAVAYVLSPGDVEGWWFRDNATSDSMPVVTFEDICPPEAGFPRVVVDDLGREVTIDVPPERIASVTLASDEILLELVGPERLLGVTHFAADAAISNIADELDGIELTDLSGDPEYLITLEADLVVLSGYNNPAALDQLVDASVPLLVLEDFHSIEDIYANIRLLGEATGTEKRAAAMIHEMASALKAIQKRVSGREPVRVLYYEPGGITYGADSTVDEIITLAGGTNVVAEAGLGAYPLIDAEFILMADPDVILLGGWFEGDLDPATSFKRDPAFGTLRAVQEGRVFAIRDAHMTAVSQYVVAGVEDVARALYPEAFSQDGELD